VNPSARVARWLCVALLVILAIGLALQPLLGRAATRTLTARFADVEATGLDLAAVLDVAEQVREFVVGGRGELPARVGAREGFDESAVAHLEDVRDVIRLARAATVLLAIVVAVVSFLAVRARRTRELAEVLVRAGFVTVALPLVAGVAGALSFDAVFTAFHGLFFESGTWTFPADSLLIQVFPEAFWAVAGVCWGGLMVLVGLCYGGLGVVLRRLGTR